MARAAWLVVTLFLSLAFAGCFGKDAPEDGLQTATTDGGLNTSAPQGRGDIVAFEETNKTEDGSGGVDHHHDYWQGRDRANIFETSAQMAPLPSENKAYATFRPPQGTFVYEATERIEFTITNPQRHACEPLVTFGGRFYCTDYPAGQPIPDPTGGPTGLYLRYKHAATIDWIDAGPIAWDAPATIKITNPIQTDMPHATSSVWEFQVVSPNAHDVTLMFDAKADLIRGGENIPMWPGHPLFYDEERPYREVLSNVQGHSCDSQGCALAAGPTDPVHAERIISYGTRTLHIWVNVTDLQTPNPALAPTAWFLYHRNATGRENITNPFDFANYGIEKRELYWTLPVDDNGMDSPYADGSRWNFELGASYTIPENPVRRQSCYGGCAQWAASYTITVRATPTQHAPEDYHLYCLDPETYCG